MVEKEEKKLIILIPSYEPDENLTKLIENLNKNKITSIVVDDGSGKDYKEIFDSLDTKVISYEKNQGKGHALKEGYKYIKDNYKEYVVVTMDSDGQHRIEDAYKLYKYILKNEDTLVLGKRPRGEKTPLRSKVGNAITRFVFHIVSGQDVYDTQTGLRAFSNKLMDYMLKVKGERFEYEMNVLLYAKNNKIPIKEIEIETIYIDNNSKSHFNAFRDSFKVYKEIISFSFSGIISFIVDYLLFIIFKIFLENITIANVIARAISSTLNYIINKNIVFKSNKNIGKSLLQYYSLVIIILVLNTIILNLLCMIINPIVSKLITEVILFIISWLVQKKLIFKKK